MVSVQACLEFDNKADVQEAILKIVREKGCFPTDTSAAEISEIIMDRM